jgi:hypothetical protein
MTKKKAMTADKELEQLLLSEDSLAQYHKMVEDLWNQAFKGEYDSKKYKAKQEFEDKILEAFSNATVDSIIEVKPDKEGDFLTVKIKSTVTEDGIEIDTKVIEEEDKSNIDNWEQLDAWEQWEQEESKEDKGKYFADFIHKHIIQMSKDGSKISEINHWLSEYLNIDNSITGNEEGRDLEKHKRYHEFIIESAVNKILGGEKVDKVLDWIKERESISSEEKLSFMDKLEHVPSYAEENPQSDKLKEKACEDISKRFDKNVNKIFEDGKKRLEEYRKLRVSSKPTYEEFKTEREIRKAVTDELESKTAGEEVRDCSKEWEEYYKRDKAKNIYKPSFPEYTDISALNHEEIERKAAEEEVKEAMRSKAAARSEWTEEQEKQREEIRKGARERLAEVKEFAIGLKAKAEELKKEAMRLKMDARSQGIKDVEEMAIEKPEFPKFKDWKDAAIEGTEAHTHMMKEGKRLTRLVYKDRIKQNSGKIFRRLVMGVTLHFMALCYLIYDYFVGLGTVGEIVFQVMTYSSFAFYFMLALASYSGLEIQRKLEEVDRKYEGY